MITVTYTIRDRDYRRINESVESMRYSTSHNFVVNVVDYGSKEDCCDNIRELCFAQELNYIRVETEGLPWNRSHAINIGVRNTNTQFVALTDIDMLFEGDILGESLKRFENMNIIYCRPLWIPRNGRKEKARLGNYRQVGGYIFLENKTFYEQNGFDERIRFWGMEDVEWNNRLTHRGYKEKWIEKTNIKMYHQWHPTPYALYNNWSIAPLYDTRPFPAIYASHYYIMENLFKEYTNSNWGEMVTLDERPILSILKKEKPYVIGGQASNAFYQDFFNAVDKHKFVKLEFGPRFQGKKFAKSMVDNIPIPYLIVRRLLRALGFDLSLFKNNNFDHFYMYLHLLKKYGLIDYYLQDDYSSIYLLFE
jgi:hypothetical protein